MAMISKEDVWHKYGTDMENEHKNTRWYCTFLIWNYLDIRGVSVRAGVLYVNFHAKNILKSMVESMAKYQWEEGDTANEEDFEK